MKKTYIIILFLLGLLTLTTCHKDKEIEAKTPVVSNEEMTVAETQATISWTVDFTGRFSTGVDVSSHENMSEARRVEASKVDGKYIAVVDGLTTGTKYYYRIVVWNRYSSYEEEEGEFVTEEKTFYQVTATCSPAEGGRVTGAGSFEENKYCTLNAISNQGYNFVNWTENGNPVSSNAGYTFKVTQNRNLVAHFAKQKFTVSVSATPSGGGTVSGGGQYDYGQSCTVTATAASGYTFSKWTEDGTQVSTNANYTFTVSSARTLVAHFTALQGDEYNVNVSASPSEGGTVTGGGVFQSGASCTVTATANTGYTFANWTENGSVVSSSASYTFTVNANRTLVANFTANSVAHAYVDLGLPSGLLWATCNIGANAPEEYGDYFAWGETQPKSMYNWSTYQYCMGTENSLTKYCNNPNCGYNGFNDNLIVMESGDDASVVSWGSGWRIPLWLEWVELYQNTSYTCTTQNGVSGILFTAMNGNSLFLPAAGYHNGNSVEYAGSNGDYWANLIDTDNPNQAWGFYFYGGDCSAGGGPRYIGQTIRAVYSTTYPYYSVSVSANPSSGGSVSGGGSYQFGSLCTVSATAASGYTFTNWTVNGMQGSTDANYTFTVTGNWNLVANFTAQAPNEYTINVSADPTNGGTVSGGGTYQQGQSCTVIATASSGYTFTKWTENGTQVSTEANYTFTVTGNRNLVANFVAQGPNYYTITVSSNPPEGGASYGGGTYQEGESCYVSANEYCPYTFLYWTENGVQVSTDKYFTFTVTSNRNLVANFRYNGGAGLPPQGAISGLFSIDYEGTQVFFSQGNLQYKASTNTWRFAPNQYDCVGSDNNNISSSYSGWIDLFGWGTSGWNCGNTYYRPWDSDNSNGSLYGPPGQYNLTDSYANSDWGYYNSISNGGNSTHQWRTLTRSEWYRLFHRSTFSGVCYAKAQVNGVNGVILLPDDWRSSYYSLNSTNQGAANYNNNVINASDWTSCLEAHGAVFLPAAGYRTGTSVGIVGSGGYYWSSSCNNSSISYQIYFSSTTINCDYSSEERCAGLSVRLVYDAN